MKKITSLLLTLIMCLSLCACGGNETTDTNETTETSVEETADNIELVLNETYSMPLFDITITGFDFTDKASDPSGDGPNILPKNGYVCANLYYDVKYTGKSTIDSSYLEPLLLDYNDGYTFLRERFYYYDAAFDAWLNSGDIDPLTDEFSCKACFFVPEEVRDNEEAPIFIDFEGYTFSPR